VCSWLDTGSAWGAGIGRRVVAEGGSARGGDGGTSPHPMTQHGRLRVGHRPPHPHQSTRELGGAPTQHSRLARAAWGAEAEADAAASITRQATAKRGALLRAIIIAGRAVIVGEGVSASVQWVDAKKLFSAGETEAFVVQAVTPSRFVRNEGP